MKFSKKKMYGITAAVAVVALTVTAVALATSFSNVAYVSIAGTNLKSAHVGASSLTFSQECKGNENLADGEVLWHFVLTQTVLPKTQSLRAEFDSAGVTDPDVGSVKYVGGVIHWNVTTPTDDILLAASTDATSTGSLNLSHVCGGGNVPAAKASISTELHSGATDSDPTVVIPVTDPPTKIALGSSVHDSAAVTFDPAATKAPAGSTVKFYFYTDGTCDNSFEGDPGDWLYESDPFDVGDQATDEMVLDPALAQAGLGAGTYSYRAFFTSGDADVVGDATSDCEPFEVEKAQLTIVTNIHNATHGEVGGATHVPLGSVVHDTATVSGAVAGFDIGAVSFTLNSVAVANGAAESGFTARSVDSDPLGAGSYTYKASVDGNANYIGGTSADEPLTVDKGTVTIRTDIHNAAHQIVTGVGNGSVVHDTTEFNSGVITGFAPTLTNVTFTFYTTRTDCYGPSSSAAATGADEVATARARSADTAPLTSGSYSYKATFSGDDNYNAATPAGCEALTVRTFGFTMGFWGNTNGQALLALNNAFTAPNIVTIGINGGSPGNTCYTVVDSAAKSKVIFPNTLNGISILLNCTASNQLDSGINVSSLNTLLAQTLAASYNIKWKLNYAGQSIAGLGCTTVSGAGTTVESARDYGNYLIGHAKKNASGGDTIVVTQTQIGAMNTLLGCLNRES